MSISSRIFLTNRLILSNVLDLAYAKPSRKSLLTDGHKMLLGKLPGWGILVLIGGLGLVLIGLPHIHLASLSFIEPYGAIPEGVGIAFLTASTLGFTIDRWMKKEIAADVFKAALGYILPEEFKNEIQRIISFKFMCEHHKMHLRVEKIGTDYVRVTTKLERKLTNITSIPESICTYAHIDEWGFSDEKSKVVSCSLVGPDDHIYEQKKPRVFNSTIAVETDTIQVPPGKSVTSRAEFVEIRRINDHMIWAFKTPTKNPIIKIDAPNDLECEWGFGSADPVRSSEFMNEKELVGMYFPGWNMRLRWYPKTTN